MRVEGLKSVQNFDKAVFLEDADEYCDGSKSDVNATNTINNMGKYDDEGEELASDGKRIGKRKKKKRRGIKRGSEDISESGEDVSSHGDGFGENHENNTGVSEEFEEEEISIFGQTTGSSNATWVECDRCKKVRLCQFDNY